MSHIVIDTETTGLSASDRICEIAAINTETGDIFQAFVNPQCAMNAGAYLVHRLSNEFLAGQPIIDEVVDEFARFVGSDAVLIGHNIGFDKRFLVREMQGVSAKLGTWMDARFADCLDTMKMAKAQGHKSAKLGDLCDLYGVRVPETAHTALGDCYRTMGLWQALSMPGRITERPGRRAGTAQGALL